MDQDGIKTGIYIHIPFCKKRCSYCDFNTYAGKLHNLPDYMAALCLEVEKVMQTYAGEMHVGSIYFGGGTPSLIDIPDLDKVMSSLAQNFKISGTAEVTLEANPGTLSLDYVQTLKRVGINRLSIGMQSAISHELEILGRTHTWEDVIQAVRWARHSGFNNISLDLIYGLPGQRMEDWQHNLEMAVSLAPEHLSLYALTLESHVPMARWINSGRLPGQNDDTMADMYETATQFLEQKGFVQYEISNWARKDDRGKVLASRHNLQYWHNLPYLGFGAGAHGYANRVRTENLLRIQPYIQRCLQKEAGMFPRGPAVKASVFIDRHREMQETMMLGLRLMEGVSRQEFVERFDVQVEDVFPQELKRLLRTGLIEETDDGNGRIRLTKNGRFLSNIVFREFVD